MTEKRAHLKPGDLVMVSYPMGEKWNNPAHKYEGETFVIKERHQPKATWKPQFTLYGCFGKNGKPYWFLADELIPY